ncbi:hypothetical protein [Roseovarius arcticus]|uniref:hypothetical protein n=1 Tax=Roseovarius arcticus TaxID=2547404 RepID=UPI00110FFF5C|nr:hypothetical protein [Roseovarius arcticus]
MTVMTTTLPAAHEACPRGVLRGMFIGLLAGALAMWLIASSNAAVSPGGGDLKAGASALPDWHGNVMRSHQPK